MSAQIQLPAKLDVLRQPKRYKVLYGGRGAAKSWGVARTLILQAVERPLRILCAREIQKTISESVHKLLSDQIHAMELDWFFHVQENQITGKNGSEFVFTGIRGQDIGKIKSYEGVDICWVEEAQTVTKKSWEVLIPTIRKPNSEIWVTFNPELDTDETYQRFVVKSRNDSIALPINWRDNPWFPDVLKAEMEHLKETDEEAYRHVWEGECRSAVEGAIYAKEVFELFASQRVRPVPHDPILKTYTVWDLGWNDQTSIIVAQRSTSEIRVIDYIEGQYRTLADYVSELKDMRLNWATDFLPHDGAAKNLQTGQSAQEILGKLGRTVAIVPNVGVDQGIKVARLQIGKCYFDEVKASRLVDCLKRYRRTINVNTNEPGAPLHDEYSHGADAFRYMALIVEQMRNETGWKPLRYPGQGGSVV